MIYARARATTKRGAGTNIRNEAKRERERNEKKRLDRSETTRVLENKREHVLEKTKTKKNKIK